MVYWVIERKKRKPSSKLIQHKMVTSGLSTGKAAKYCLVTADTVKNWIQAGLLPAQRTAGGQYRVRIDDLRQFMIERDMSVEELDQDVRETPLEYCWEYYRKRERRHVRARSSCDTCVVKRTWALICYELRKDVDHRRVHCRADCSDCGYYQRYAQVMKSKTEGHE